MPLAYLPSPTRSAIFLGPLPIRFYALCIIAGIVLAVWLGGKRFAARGGRGEDVLDVAGWAVVFGIFGGRLYHVLSDPELYFLGRPGTSPLDAVKIWDGGLGIWGAIALGAIGAWIGCRRHGLRLPPFADAVVPGVVFAQAIGRLGNYFNNELYGRQTTLPWKLQVHAMDLQTGKATGTLPGFYHPTFLYELLWDAAVGTALILADRLFRLGHGQVMALYLMAYTAGRSWIESLRVDTANEILGLRLNIWTSGVVFLLGLGWFVTHRRPREESVHRNPQAVSASDSSQAGGAEASPLTEAMSPAHKEDITMSTSSATTSSNRTSSKDSGKQHRR